MEKLIGLVAPALAFLADVASSDITSGRAKALATVALGLVSLIIGAVAFIRARRGTGRIAAIIAVVLGIIGLIVSVLHIAGSSGFGTGGGRLGAIVALVLSLIGTILGGLAFSRRPAGGE